MFCFWHFLLLKLFRFWIILSLLWLSPPILVRFFIILFLLWLSPLFLLRTLFFKLGMLWPFRLNKLLFDRLLMLFSLLFKIQQILLLLFQFLLCNLLRLAILIDEIIIRWWLNLYNFSIRIFCLFNYFLLLLVLLLARRFGFWLLVCWCA